MDSLYEDVQNQFNKTCDILGVSENLYRFIRKPARSVIVNFPLRKDDGTLEMVEGCRVLHTNAMGPGKGGIRILPENNIQQIEGLAMLMTWKCALIGLPLSGAKGGITIDPKQLSLAELERTVRGYTSAVKNVIGPSQDIPGPGLNANASVMAWMMDTYSMGIGQTSPGVCTGKPVEIGGISGRNQAVGWGLAYIMRNYSRRETEPLKGQKVVIQGIGHVGKNVARTARQFGAKIVGISDSTAGLYCEDGLDINDIIEYKQKYGQLKGFDKKNVEKITNAELLCLPCDVLTPCAVHDQITTENVDKLQCKTIIEGANAPISFEADQILDEKRITVIPDIIANAGGVITSYFEWVQGLSKLRWTTDRVSHELETIILDAFEKIYQIKHDQAVSYRRAAHMIAVEHLVKAIKYRGIYP